jgi:hypothetical protein
MHSLLTNTTDLLRIITGSAADLHCAVSFIEYTNASPPVLDALDTQFTECTAAETRTILGAPTSSSDRRKVKAVSIVNTHASISTTLRVVIERTGPVTWDLFNTITLQPGESLTFTEGIGWFHNKLTISVPVGSTNKLIGADQSLGTSDVYLNNSNMKLDGLGVPTIGRAFHWKFIVSKTAAGTATPIIQVRVGTAGAIGDTSRVTFTWGAGTAAVDRGEFELDVMFTAVGASAVLRGKANLTSNLTTTGLSNAVKALQPADSGTFDSGVANSQIGLSYNAGASGAHTLEYLSAFTDNF